jgi:hypothetical protein
MNQITIKLNKKIYEPIFDYFVNGCNHTISNSQTVALNLFVGYYLLTQKIQEGENKGLTYYEAFSKTIFGKADMLRMEKFIHLEFRKFLKDKKLPLPQ